MDSSELWAILPSHARSIALQDSSRLAAAGRRSELPAVEGRTAVLPLYGVLTQRGQWGGTSMQAFGAAFDQAIADPRVAAVVIDVDSPGGTVAGTQVLADQVFKGSREKPVAAVANSLAASAAYWIASQARYLYASPGGEAGSIGVFRLHEDHSERLRKEGVQITLLGTPEYKTEASPFRALSAEAREHHMQQVEQSYDRFVEAVARGRRTSAHNVRSGYGRGRLLNAKQAEAARMVDGVYTLPQVLRLIGGGSQQTDGASLGAMRAICQAARTHSPRRFSTEAARQKLMRRVAADPILRSYADGF